MSMALGFSGRDKSRRRSCHRRNDSGELDVFAANTYLSAANDELFRRGATTTLYQQLGLDVRDDQYCTTTKQGWREGRVSIDIPMSHHHNHQQNHHAAATTGPQPQGPMEKKHRQPSSPGGKLASFFSSLMSQKLSKKKNSPNPNSAKEGAPQEESPSSWRRIRRSSIGHFMSSNSTRVRTTTSSDTTATATRFQCVSVRVGSEESRCTAKSNEIDSRSTQSSLGVLETRSLPSRVINTPIKSFKEFSGFPDQKKPYKTKTSATNPSSSANLDRFEEKFKNINGSSEKQPKGLDRCRGGSEKDKSRVDRNSIEESREFKRFMEEDGGESDSSSDLFELKLNYEHEFHLGFCSSGLPVYETTHMDTIKRSSSKPVANV